MHTLRACARLCRGAWPANGSRLNICPEPKVLMLPRFWEEGTELMKSAFTVPVCRLHTGFTATTEHVQRLIKASVVQMFKDNRKMWAAFSKTKETSEWCINRAPRKWIKLSHRRGSKQQRAEIQWILSIFHPLVLLKGQSWHYNDLVWLWSSGPAA